jgi:hypothetical protein
VSMVYIESIVQVKVVMFKLRELGG